MNFRGPRAAGEPWKPWAGMKAGRRREGAADALHPAVAAADCEQDPLSSASAVLCNRADIPSQTPGPEATHTEQVAP